MSEHGIIFMASSIHGIIAGRKTVTRRTSKTWLKVKAGDRLWVRERWASMSKYIVAYEVGAECGAWMGDGEGGQFWNHHGYIIESPEYHEVASKTVAGACRTFGLKKYGGVPHGPWPHTYGWRSPMFMPRWAARYFLEATEDAREEPLQNITPREALAEGIIERVLVGQPGKLIYTYEQQDRPDLYSLSPIEEYERVWGMIHKKPGERWGDNPTIVRVAFKLICPPGGHQEVAP